MTMTFYIGKEIKEYEKRFKIVKREFLSNGSIHTNSNSEAFRCIVDRLFTHIMDKRIKRNRKEAEADED